MNVDFPLTSTSSHTCTHSSESSDQNDQNDDSRMDESPTAPSSLETSLSDSSAKPSSETPELNSSPHQCLCRQHNPMERFSEFQT